MGHWDLSTWSSSPDSGIPSAAGAGYMGTNDWSPPGAIPELVARDMMKKEASRRKGAPASSRGGNENKYHYALMLSQNDQRDTAYHEGARGRSVARRRHR
eukprot:GHVT01074001.1.p2 GENE.GHVT01074001.1~~GHVT01074001.1.p2  ORF type:complete len:100 (+),score=15.72 GHVT01074001.1:1529-1828(+)